MPIVDFPEPAAQQFGGIVCPGEPAADHRIVLRTTTYRVLAGHRLRAALWARGELTVDGVTTYSHTWDIPL